MAQDFLLDIATHDILLKDNTTVQLCETTQDVVRQRVDILLKTFTTEWFADADFGVPYFTQIYGKGTQTFTKQIFRSKILSVEGITGLLSLTLEVNDERKATVVFSATTESGTITNARVTL